MSFIERRDFWLDITRGLVNGFSEVLKFGRNPVVDTNTDPEDVWDAGGLWVPPTTARLHDIVSTSTDDAAAGTGARTVQVYGLDASGELQNETITLNGTTDVPTASTYTMIHRMIVRTAGSGGANAGVLTATAQTDATVTAHIAVGNNQTLMAIYQIPSNKTAYGVRWYGNVNKSGAAGTAQIQLRVMEMGQVWAVKSHLGLQTTGASHIDHEAVVPLEIPASALVKIQINEVSANSTDVSAGFDLVLVDND